jgi:hypothetical protein
MLLSVFAGCRCPSRTFAFGTDSAKAQASFAYRRWTTGSRSTIPRSRSVYPPQSTRRVSDVESHEHSANDAGLCNSHVRCIDLSQFCWFTFAGDRPRTKIDAKLEATASPMLAATRSGTFEPSTAAGDKPGV